MNWNSRRSAPDAPPSNGLPVAPERPSFAKPPSASEAPNGFTMSAQARQRLADLKFQIHEQLLKELNLDRVNQTSGTELRRGIEEAAATMIATEDIAISRADRQRLVREIADEILGFGPLEPLLADVQVSEIMVNGPDKVFVERAGLLSISDVAFRDDAHIMRIIDRIISPLGRRLDESSPMVDARLPDGSRVNAIIPPLSVDGPTMTIRKFAHDPLTAEKLIEYGSLSPEITSFLNAAVESRTNILVSGGTGTGKTTMLNVLSAFIPARERIVTIEDPCELQMRQPHVVRLETRPPNIEGKGEVTQRQLVRNALRMRPDRIIVGEVRTGEAFDMLQAMNTGHEGSITTVHANAPRDALARIENMVLMASLDLPVRAIREQIASAIQLIVHIRRYPDGSRRVSHVTEIAGMEGDMITLQDIFLFRQDGIDEEGHVRGAIQSTGLRPRCADKIEQQGIALLPRIFARTGENPWRL